MKNIFKIKWIPGRQNSNYFVHNVFSSKLLMSDCWLIKYPKFGYVSRHKDPAPGRIHWRLNIELRKSRGVFQCEGPSFRFGRITIFRPDLYYHSYCNLDSKSRLVLSFGISLKGKVTEEPKWNWIPFTEQERLYGRTDYENQMEFVTPEMADRMRNERASSYETYLEELNRYRTTNLDK
jgi:hypothetical protein